jgi:hypothetical protein
MVSHERHPWVVRKSFPFSPAGQHWLPLMNGKEIKVVLVMELFWITCAAPSKVNAASSVAMEIVFFRWKFFSDNPLQFL